MPCYQRLFTAIAFVLVFLSSKPSVAVDGGSNNETKAEEIERFEREIRPILENSCIVCHGADMQESGLRLDTAEGVFHGGDSGPIITPYRPEESRLIQVVRGTGDLQMPPGDRLPKKDIDLLEQWVRNGAIWPNYKHPVQPSSPSDEKLNASFTSDEKSFWAFQPIHDSTPPAVTDSTWIRTPIDRFILSRLEQTGLRPAQTADKRTLLRRVTYDLTGLPPTRDELAAFLADDSPNAFATVVDRLLSSKHYGEKWGQHWLDAVRFAESAGLDANNAYLNAWQYRDYVIRSFNADKPYDEFLIEQLAGDLLPESDSPAQNYDQVVATGFLQVGTKPVIMQDKRQMLLEIADEQLNTVGVAMLGLTIGCARCHDHKFDPIPTSDYYSLAGIFTSTRVMADKEKFSKWCEKSILDAEGNAATVMAVEDLPDPKNLQIHYRGNFRTLGPEAPRRFLQIIEGEGHAPIDTKGSGRLELARWIASRENPLTARVMVNRIWQYHFGRGLVATSGNFGKLGDRPTHPELLDWLAARFIESGWSVKAMHRLLLLSGTYQQSCSENSKAAELDPENNLLWSMRRRRLLAEEIRDSLLAVSGTLDPTPAGTIFNVGFSALVEERGLFLVDISKEDPYPPYESLRRSIYLPVLRNSRPEILKLFDVGDQLAPTAVRGETTVASQSLFLMNSMFVRQRAMDIAIRLLHQTTPVGDNNSDKSIIERAYWIILGRVPTPNELQIVTQFLKAYRSRLTNADLQSHDQSKLNSTANNQFDLITRQERNLIGYFRFADFEFDGLSKAVRVDLPTRQLNHSQAMSAEAWVRPVDSQTATVIGCDGPEGKLWRIGIETREEHGAAVTYPFYQFYNGDAGQFVIQDARAVVPRNSWTHILLTIGDAKLTVYVNGIKVHEKNTTTILRPFNLPLVIGSRGDRSQWFRGNIDHVAIYDRVMNSQDAERRYQMFATCHLRSSELPELFVWRALCQTLLCSNEFMYLE